MGVKNRCSLQKYFNNVFNFAWELATYLDCILGAKRRAPGSHPHLFITKPFHIPPITQKKKEKKKRIFSTEPRWKSKQHLKAVMQVRGLLSLKEYFLPHLQRGYICTDYQTVKRERKGRLFSESSRTCLNSKCKIFFLIHFCGHQNHSKRS